MPGTKSGGEKAKETVKRLYGDEFYVSIGRKGGKVTGISKGFGSDKHGKDGLSGKERAVVAGKKSRIIKNNQKKGGLIW